MNCLFIVVYIISSLLLLLSFSFGHSIEKYACYGSSPDPEGATCCEGYRLIDKECIPKCEGGCPVSQVCLEPNVCGCVDNSFETDDKRCSMCIYTFSNLTFHSKCSTCKPKYTFINDQCEYLCNHNCVNGYCYKSQVCICSLGYQKNPHTNICEPVNCENYPDDSDCQNFSSTSRRDDSLILQTATETAASNCIDGICQNQTSTFSERETNFSYTKTDFTDENPTMSTPTDVRTNFTINCSDDICQTPDDNSTMSTPTDVTSNCQNGCWGGMCIDGICQCKEGLILNESTNDCIMPCENNCQNGVCNEDRICECNLGYVHKNGSGCVPQCDQECINGICVAPTHCECIEGDVWSFNISSALECLPTCEGVNGKHDCQNGTCVALNKCRCLNGFIPKPGNRFECISGLKDSAGSHIQNFWYSLWIIAVLALLVLILLACLAHKRLRRVSYNVDKVEKYRSTVVFEVNERSECAI